MEQLEQVSVDLLLPFTVNRKRTNTTSPFFSVFQVILKAVDNSLLLFFHLMCKIICSCKR